MGTQSQAVLLLSDSLTVEDVVSNAREVALAVDDALAVTDELLTAEDVRRLIEDSGTLRDLAPGDPVVGAQMASRGIGLRFDDAAAISDDLETAVARATRVLIFQSDRSVVTIAVAEDAARVAVGDRALVMLVIGARREGLIHEADKEDE